MTESGRSAVLIVFVDSLPYARLGDMPRLSAWRAGCRLRPGFGFSVNLHAELFAGLTPDEVGFFGEWTYDPPNAPCRRLRHVLPILDRLMRPYALNRGLQTMLTRRYRPDHVMPNLPLRWLDKFAIHGEHILSPRFPGPTLFTRHSDLLALDPKSAPKGRRDGRLVSSAHAAIQQGASRLFVPLPDLDGIGHVHGTASSEYATHLERIDAWVSGLAGRFLERQAGGHVFVLSDHGMANVSAGVRFGIETECGIARQSSYLYFTDSTMVRVWVFDPGLRAPIQSYLEHLPSGRVLSESERRVAGVANRRFGDFIFILREGLCFEPSTFARRIPKAMHGYHPDQANQQAVLLYRGPGPWLIGGDSTIRRTIDVYPILNAALT
jgi:hypothetical protein